MPAQWHSVYTFISKIRKPPKKSLSGQKEELIYAPLKGANMQYLICVWPLKPEPPAHAPDHTGINVTPKILWQMKKGNFSICFQVEIPFEIWSAKLFIIKYLRSREEKHKNWTIFDIN